MYYQSINLPIRLARAARAQGGDEEGRVTFQGTIRLLVLYHGRFLVRAFFPQLGFLSHG